MTVLASSVSHGGALDYQISRSLRFNSVDTASLTRTPGSAGDRRKWTWSGWVKINTIGTHRALLSGTGGGGSVTWFRFNSSDQIDFVNYDGASFIANTQSSAVFRDPSAWLHIVGVFDSANATAANRFIVYVNGVLQTMTNTSPTQNSDSYINNTGAQYIGREARSATYLFDGYMADVHLIDGQALTPSSFGQTDSITGVWVPKAYSGTYGTNGFKLTFSDNSNTTATTLGKDSSGNGNNYTPSNFSVTTGPENDSLVDSPTNYGTDTGVGGEVRGNYCIWNYLEGNASRIRNGGLGNVGGGDAPVRGTIAVSSGKWYWEVTIPTGNAPQNHHGIWSVYENPTSYTGATAGSWGMFDANGNKRNNGSYLSYGTGFAANDIVMTALDMDNGKIWWGKNGTWFNSGSPTAGTNAAFTNILSVTNTIAPAHNQYEAEHYNFGQRPFSYTAPSGYKCLCSTNLPSTIGATAATQASKYFDVVLRNGFGSSGGSISSLAFQPDFMWEKPRGNVASYSLFDSGRGVSKVLVSNSNAAEVTDTTYLLSFNSNGYSMGATDYATSVSLVDWVWKAGGANVTNTSGTIQSKVSASTASGFSIVTYTGNGSSSTIGHGLGKTPDMIITKQRNDTWNWMTYHSSLGSTKYVYLNYTDGSATDSNTYSSAPTSSVWSVGTNVQLNGNGSTYVAYCFTGIEGYSKFGSYIGNGSTDGTFIYLGFRPKWFFVKNINVAYDWKGWDSVRDSYNVAIKPLWLNLNNAEGSVFTTGVDFLSNGIKIRSNDAIENNSGSTYIYAAFAESPFKYSRAR